MTRTIVVGADRGIQACVGRVEIKRTRQELVSTDDLGYHDPRELPVGAWPPAIFSHGTVLASLWSISEMNLRTLSLVGLLILPRIASAAAPIDDEQFQPLFNGKSLDGWKMVNTKDNFLVKDGILVMDRGKGWLATEKTYGDFVLKVRYRFVTPGADSGIFIRSSLEGNNWTNRGYQIQNMDNQTLGKIVGMGVKVAGEHKTDVLKDQKKPAGEWMDLTITAKGTHGEVALGGETIATSDDLQLHDGHIGLQAEGGVLEFERIEIQSLGKE